MVKLAIMMLWNYLGMIPIIQIFICKLLGHLRYGNLVPHINNGKNTMSEVYSTFWGDYKFCKYYVIINTQRSF
jgi:hypothetical protein